MSSRLHAVSPHEAEIQALVRALRGYGILTRDGLREAAHGDCWRDSFDLALADGIAEGRIKRLAPGLYELGEAARPGAAA